MLKRQTSEKASMREGIDALHAEDVNLCSNVKKIAGGESFIAQTTGEIRWSKEELKQQHYTAF